MFAERVNSVCRSMSFPATNTENKIGSLFPFQSGQHNFNANTFGNFAAFRCVPSVHPMDSAGQRATSSFIGSSQLPMPYIPSHYVNSDISQHTAHQSCANLSTGGREIFHPAQPLNSAEFDRVSNRQLPQFNPNHKSIMNGNQFLYGAAGLPVLTSLQNYASILPQTYALRLKDNSVSGQATFGGNKTEESPIQGRNCPSKKTWKVILTPELAATIYKFKPNENEKKSSSVRLSRRSAPLTSLIPENMLPFLLLIVLIPSTIPPFTFSIGMG